MFDLNTCPSLLHPIPSHPVHHPSARASSSFFNLCFPPASSTQCKLPFSYLWTHRVLDGSISDFPQEESLCLLKRAEWFTEHVRVRAQAGRQLLHVLMSVHDKHVLQMTSVHMYG